MEYFIALVGFVLGFSVACFIIAKGCKKDDENTEKRGVWTIRDRAYRLSPIIKDDLL